MLLLLVQIGDLECVYRISPTQQAYLFPLSLWKKIKEEVETKRLFGEYSLAYYDYDHYFTF